MANHPKMELSHSKYVLMPATHKKVIDFYADQLVATMQYNSRVTKSRVQFGEKMGRELAMALIKYVSDMAADVV